MLETQWTTAAKHVGKLIHWSVSKWTTPTRLVGKLTLSSISQWTTPTRLVGKLIFTGLSLSELLQQGLSESLLSLLSLSELLQQGLSESLHTGLSPFKTQFCTYSTPRTEDARNMPSVCNNDQTLSVQCESNRSIHGSQNGCQSDGNTLG